MAAASAVPVLPPAPESTAANPKPKPNHVGTSTDTQLDISISRLLSLDDDEANDNNSDKLFCWTRGDDDDDNDDDVGASCNANADEDADSDNWTSQEFMVALNKSSEAEIDAGNVSIRIRPATVGRSRSILSSASRREECEIAYCVPSLRLEQQQSDRSTTFNQSGKDGSDRLGYSYSWSHYVGASDSDIPSLVDNTVTTIGDDDDMYYEESEEESEETVNEVDLLQHQHPPSKDPLLESEDNDLSEDDTTIDDDQQEPVSTSDDADYDDILAKAITAVLQEHHLQNHHPPSYISEPHSPCREWIVPSQRHESSLAVATRRDSCSTMSTAPDTPESSLVISEYICVRNETSPKTGQLVAVTTTTSTNPATEPCTCRGRDDNDDARCDVLCRQCAHVGRGTCKTEPSVWPLAFFFVCPTEPVFPTDLSGIKCAKKFLPDPLTVGDFYGDDDEEIRFVPPSSTRSDVAAVANCAAAGVPTAGASRYAWGHEEEEIVFMPREEEHDGVDDNYDYETITTYREDDENDVLWHGNGKKNPLLAA